MLKLNVALLYMKKMTTHIISFKIWLEFTGWREKCSNQRRLDEMIESPFFPHPQPPTPNPRLMTMHMWVRGERGGCGGNRGTVLDELAVEGRQKEGEGVETPAYGSWHRRLDQQEGRIRGPLKHSVFGNQVFNVSGSCNGHQGYRVQTICPIAQDTVIIFIQLRFFSESIKDIDACHATTTQESQLLQFDFEFFLQDWCTVQCTTAGYKIVSMKPGWRLHKKYNMSSRCNFRQFPQKFQQPKAHNLNAGLSVGEITFAKINITLMCVRLEFKVQVAALGKYTANIQPGVKRCTWPVALCINT